MAIKINEKIDNELSDILLKHIGRSQRNEIAKKHGVPTHSLHHIVYQEQRIMNPDQLNAVEALRVVAIKACEDAELDKQFLINY